MSAEIYSHAPGPRRSDEQGRVAVRRSTPRTLQTSRNSIPLEECDMSLRALGRSLSDEFTTLQKLGAGTFGSVSKVRLHGGDETFALKLLSFDTAEEQTYVKREVQCLRDVNHPHVVRIVDAFSLGPDRAGILMEYVETNVEYWLSTLPDGPVPKQQMTTFGLQLFSGLEALHERSILHRDIKPANLLFDRASEIVKIGDLGNARRASPHAIEYTRKVGSLWYRPPELLLGAKIYGPEVDTWAAGCVMWELIASEPAFPGQSEITMLHHIFRLLGTPSAERWAGLTTLPFFSAKFPKWHGRLADQIFRHDPSVGEACVAFFQRVLSGSPDLRLRAADACTHEFLAPSGRAPKRTKTNAAVAGT